MAAPNTLRLGSEWLVDIGGIRFQVQRVGQTGHWLLIAGGEAAREVAQRVLTPPPSPDASAPSWVLIHVDDEDAKALRVGLLFPRPQSVRQFAWFYEGDPIPQYAVAEIWRLNPGPAAPVPDDGKQHLPNPFL